MFGPFRLLCALLTLLLVAPALQAGGCVSDMGAETVHHGAHGDAPHLSMAPAASTHEGHGAHHPAEHGPAQPKMPHDCIGCIAPIDVGVYRPIEPLQLTFGDIGLARRPVAMTDSSGAPETPPPRHLV